MKNWTTYNNFTKKKEHFLLASQRRTLKIKNRAYGAVLNGDAHLGGRCGFPSCLWCVGGSTAAGLGGCVYAPHAGFAGWGCVGGGVAHRLPPDVKCPYDTTNTLASVALSVGASHDKIRWGG